MGSLKLPLSTRLKLNLNETPLTMIDESGTKITGVFIDANDVELVKQLEEDSDFLQRLKAAGVDNWEGYCFAFGSCNHGDD